MAVTPLTILIAFGCIALYIAGRWKMFTKAGEAGWKSLVPFYSDYVLFKLVWYVKSFWIYVAACIAFVLFTALAGQIGMDASGQLQMMQPANGFFGFLAYACSLLIIVYTVMLSIRTALAYGKKMPFAIGLLLVPSVFTAILGLGKSSYRGSAV